MSSCTRCGKEIDAGQEPCPHCGVSVPTPGSPSPALTIVQLLAEARAQRGRGDFTQAVTLCTRVLRLDPQHASAHSLMGDLYRDQGNFREALSWYKLAVRLQDSPEDRRKLDEMIDRVFVTTVPQEIPSTAAERVVLSSGPEIIPLDGDHDIEVDTGLRRLINRIQPIHLVLGCAAVAILAASIYLMLTTDGGKRAKDTAANTPPGGATAAAPAKTLPNDINLSGTPQVTPPPADPVESPSGVQGLPGIIMQPPASAASSAPAAQRPAAPAPEQTAPEIAPFDPTPLQPKPLASHDPEEVKRQAQSLRDMLHQKLSTDPYPGSVTDLTIDPITGATMIAYTVPPMLDAANTKMMLLSHAFTLMWAARDNSNIVRAFSLRGYAPDPATGKSSLAMLADVSLQHVDAARGKSDYSAILPYIQHPWWRDDLRTSSF